MKTNEKYKHVVFDSLTAVGHGIKLEVKEGFPCSRAKRCNISKHGTVLIAKVIEGRVLPGEKITLSFGNGKTLEDQIATVEVNCERVPEAVINENIGISLKNSRIKTIMALKPVEV